MTCRKPPDTRKTALPCCCSFATSSGMPACIGTSTRGNVSQQSLEH
jgi:hypothetical protein